MQKMEEEMTGRLSVVAPGSKAPDFEARAFLDGDFVDIRLSDYAGKWVLLLFYPADFTFV